MIFGPNIYDSGQPRTPHKKLEHVAEHLPKVYSFPDEIVSPLYPPISRFQTPGKQHKGCSVTCVCITRGPNLDGFRHRYGPKRCQNPPQKGGLRSNPPFWVDFEPFRCPKPSILGPRSMQKPLNKHPPNVAPPFSETLTIGRATRWDEEDEAPAGPPPLPVSGPVCLANFWAQGAGTLPSR